MKKFITRMAAALCALHFAAGVQQATAQVASLYSFSQSSGTQTLISGGTKLNSGSNYDDEQYAVSIPNFYFDGNWYGTMYVSTNGFITFGSAPATNNYTPLISTATYTGAISPFGANIMNSGSGTREVRWQQVGTEVVVQWQGARRASSASSESFTVQARMDTATGVIKFVYSAVTSLNNNTGEQPQVGLRGPNNTFATNVNNRMVNTGINDWNSSIAGTANSSTCRFTNASPIRSFTAGQTYTWTPACVSPMATAAASAGDCTTGMYSITVNVSRLGSAANVTIQSPAGTNLLANVGTGTYTIGPIPVGTSRTVRVVHNGNAACNLDLGSFTSDINLCMANGACLSNPYLAIPDNGCSSSNTATAGIAISGLNNALGTTVDLQSVEMIVAHASRGELQITLTSPSGQTRQLSMNNGGTRDNLGDPTNCPGGSLTFSDGAATAFSSNNSNNPTGNYRPDQTLAGFTGDPNGTWTVTICDGTSGTTGTLRRIKLNFCDRPVINSTTSNSPVCQGTALQLGVSATGNNLTYAWSGTGTFSPNATSANVSVAGAATGSYGITVGNGCNSTSASVPVTVKSSPTGVTASASAASVCSNANTVNLSSAGTAPNVTILSQDFNGGIAPWTTTNTSTGGTPANAAWTPRADGYQFNAYDGLVTFHSNDASQFVLSNSDAQGSGGTTATTLVSPSFSTVGYSAASLGFFHYYRYNSGNDDRAYVEASTNGSTWTTLQTYSSTQGSATGFAQVTVSLGSYLNQATVYVRFRYAATWDYYWAIDNVTVSGTATPSFAWSSTPAGFTSNQQNPANVAVTQNTVYTVTATSPNGCTTSASTGTVSFVQAPAATIAYGGSPYCANAGSIAVSRTGTAGGTYTAPGGLSINASTGAVNAGASTPGTYTVTYTIAASGGCAAYSTTGGITIDALPTTAAAGSAQSVCLGGSATLAANAALSGTGAWSVVSGPSLNTSQFSNTADRTATFLPDGGAGVYTLRWTISHGACTPSTSDVAITITDCAYYSQSSGTFADPIWATAPVGTPGPATFSASTSMVVQGGHTVTGTANADVRQLTVQAGGTLALNAGTTLTVNGDAATFNGTVNAADNSTLKLAGSTATTLAASSALSLWNLTVHTAQGTSTAATIAIRGTLQLDAGTFNASGADITLRSQASGTGRLGPVAAGAAYTGNLTVERYIPAGHTNWRMLASPVQGRTVQDWKDDFFTAGFPGSHYPNFYNPVNSNTLWPSIRWYNEAVASANADDGITGVSSASQALTPGQGFLAWCGDNFSTTNAFTVDVTGTPTIAAAPFTLPMSFTSSGNLAADGWNLVSNPLPSPIDFTKLNRGADVQNAYWIFDPVAGNNKSWVNGVGQGGLNGKIQSSQGFWMKADGSATTTTLDESAKVNQPAGGIFGGDQAPALPLLNLTIASSINSFSDEATIAFAQGTPAYDAIDALKMTFRSPGAPQLGIRSSDNQLLAVDFYGSYSEAITIPLQVGVDITGTYTITAAISGINTLSCLTLTDLQTGTSTPLTDGATYSFSMNATDNPAQIRFVLNGSRPLPLAVADAQCNGQAGSATADLGQAPANITWADAFGNTLLAQENVAGQAQFTANAGNYQVRITPGGACSQLSADFTITAPAALDAAATTAATSCPHGTDGSAQVAVAGGTAPYTFLWSNGTTGETLTAAAGTYTATITDAHGCTEAVQAAIPAGEGVIAQFAVAGDVAVAGSPVQFINNTVLGQAYAWDFGDGQTGTEEAPAHTYATPGTYTVSLGATGGTCTDTYTMALTVEAATAVAAADPAAPLAVWATPDQLVIEHPFGNAPVDVDVFDATGRLAMSHARMAKPGRITLGDRSLNTGVWYVRITSGEVQRTFRVPLVR